MSRVKKIETQIKELSPDVMQKGLMLWLVECAAATVAAASQQAPFAAEI